MTNNRMIPIGQVLKIIDDLRELAKQSEIMSAVGALGEVRDALLAAPSPPLHTDEERAALDAYSVVRAPFDRDNRTFTNKDHRNALMAAVAAVDEVRFRRFAESVGVKIEPTERPHVTPIGGNLGVKPLGSPDPTPIKPLPASKSSPRLHQYKFGPAGSIETIMLTTGQREALRTIASQEKIRRGGICPRWLLASATSTSLLRRDLVTKHDYPLIGYRLTERGQAVVAALTAD